MTAEVKSETVEIGSDNKIYVVRLIEERIEINENWLTQNREQLDKLKAATDADMLKMVAFEADYYAKKTGLPK